MIKIVDKRKRRYIWLFSIIIVLAILITSCFIYLNDYYRADTKMIASITQPKNVTKEVLEDDSIVYATSNPKTGFIFYPGGKVEYTSYIPLMQELAKKNILCILVEMPFNLAVLNQNAADGLQEKYPEIENWYIGGHSLGGAMAASYVCDHVNSYEGLVLLGAYSTVDLSKSDLNVLSIYGSEDQVMNYEKYESNKDNLPNDFSQFVIEGGCHAYFGMYGHQDGDGIAKITNMQQIMITADQIIEFINDK